MSGLGLMGALDAYQQGVNWKQGQEEIARAKQMQVNLDEANKAAAGVIESSKAEWALNGAQGQYRPNEQTMFKAAEAKSQALAKAGMWDHFMQNEAQVAPMRMKARAAALQRYESDGDPDALARAVYPTLFDGKEIVGSEKIEGAPGSTNLGLAPIASKLRLKLSDGTTKDIVPEELAKMVKVSLTDPVEAAKREATLNFEAAKAKAEAEAKAAIERVKGEEARKTEGVKGKNAVTLQGLKHAGDLEVTGLTNASREKVALGNNQTSLAIGSGHDRATLGAAGIGADSRIAVAEAKAAAAATGGGNKKDQQYDQLHDEAIRVYGDEQLGALGGTKTGNESTQAMAAYAAALRESNPGLSVPEAIRQSAAAWKRTPAGKAWEAQQQRKARLKGPAGE